MSTFGHNSTYNEINYIEDAIKSIDFADQIIVNSFSTDGTRESNRFRLYFA
jgi:glycosyltransferase involved in cell wall biosynthesis